MNASITKDLRRVFATPALLGRALCATALLARGLLLWLAVLFSSGQARAQLNAFPVTQVPMGTAAEYGLLSGGSIQANCQVRVFGKAGAAGSVAAGIQATQGSTAQGGNGVGQALSDCKRLAPTARA